MAKDVQKTQEAALPAHLAELDSSIAGLGNSTSAADNTLPFLAIVQKGSPQINKQEPQYIRGAEVGMLFNTATGRLFDGEAGTLLVPCGFRKAFVEWVPRSAGGGYVATHEFSMQLAKDMGARKNERGGLDLPSGNQLVETAYTFVLVDGSPLVIGASSTALKPMRDWMSRRNEVYIQGKRAPAFARTYRARTVYQKNEAGDWYNWKIEDEGWTIDAGIYQRALEFAQAIVAGDVQVGRPDEMTGGAAPDGDDGINV